MNPADSPIFIFSSGQRTGSTLLQRYLLSNPNVMIWGENAAVLSGTTRRFLRLEAYEEKNRKHLQAFLDDGVNNFVPKMNPAAFYIREAQVNLIRELWQRPAIDMGREYWGFKEVRYGADEAKYLRRLFPGTRIIHLTRNIIDCFISVQHWEHSQKTAWNRDKTKDVLNKWVQINQSFRDMPGTSSDWVFHLKYEDMTGNTEATMKSLVHWLGFEFSQFDLDVFSHKIHCFKGKKDNRCTITRDDLTEDDIALLTTDEIASVLKSLNYEINFSCR